MKKLILALFFMLVLSFNVFAAGNLTMSVLSVSPSSIVSGSAVTLSFTLTNSDPVNSITSIQIKNNGNLVNTISSLTANGSTTQTVTVNPTGSAGTYTGTLSATDSSGANSDSKTYSVSIVSPLTVQICKGENYNQCSDIGSPLVIDLESGESENKLLLKLTNNGNSALTNVKGLAVFSSLKDSDDNLVSVLNPLPVSSLGVGQSITLTFNFDADTGFHPSTLEGTLRIQSDQINATDYSLNLNVKPSACQPNADTSKIGLDINTPEKGDEFTSGDKVSVDLDVDNNANDDLTMKVTGFLYNLGKYKKITSYTVRKTINSDDTKNFKFNLDLGQIKDSNARLYVKVMDDDNELNCRSNEVKLDVTVPDDKIEIQNPSFSQSTVSCGARIDGSTLLQNVGSNDESVAFDVYSTGLGITQAVQNVDLGTNTDDDSQVVNFGFTVPTNVKDGTYPVVLRAKYNGELTISQLNLNVQGCGSVVQQTTVNAVPVTTSDNSLVSTGTTVYTQKGLFDVFNKSTGIPTSALILVNVLIVVLIIGALVYLFRPR